MIFSITTAFLFLLPGVAISTNLDLALNKPAWSGGTEFLAASNANDGDGGTSNYAYFSARWYETSSWWLVDLETQVRSVSAKIFVRSEKHPIEERIEVMLQDPRNLTGFPNNITGTVCPHTKTNREYDDKELTVTCPQSVWVRYLWIVYLTSKVISLDFVSVYIEHTTLTVFQEVTGHERPSALPTKDLGITTTKLVCARYLTSVQHSDMDGFKWDPVDKVCYLYYDAEDLHDAVEVRGQEANIYNLYIRPT